ncbi:sigma-54 dependent transcriptional regulator [Cognatishimia sp. WU-CL00825]|uniref:sigma-54-dependent transcriptional regulator n=1 Tax=Cognatishimia sp. WU-CL00825 TaxID=3127658 RepID=UPI0031034D6D
MTNTVLLVDDDRAVRDALSQTLMLADYDVITAGSYIEAKDHISAALDGVIVSDIRMPGKDGFALLAFTKTVDPDLPVVLLTGEGDIPMAVRGVQSGAFNFLEKPCETKDFLAVVAGAVRARSMVLENRQMRQQLESGDAAARMLFGHSEQAETLRNQARRAAAAGTDVLVLGAPGSGNAKVAEVIHLLADGTTAPFEKLSAAGLTKDALVAALDGAAGGSLFLDEIAAMAPDVQFALLNRLETNSQTRVIAGSYRDLQLEMQQGRLNAELFYRLNVMQVRIPTLKERPEDIPVLFRAYVRIASTQTGVAEPEVTPDVVADLMAQDWPGNARALMNTATRFVLGVHDGDPSEELGLSEQMARVERSLLTSALKRHAGNATEAAKALKLPRKTFYDKLARHEIRAELYR